MSPSPANDARLWGSSRLSLAIVGFFGFANVFALRVNLSLVMVCMINHTAVEELHLKEMESNHESNETEMQMSANQSHQNSTEGDFAWSKHEQGLILSSFFWGYMVTQIPGGVLAERFGGKNVFLYPMLIAALCTILCPLAAKLHIVVFMAVRVVIGLCQGFVFPAMHSIWSQWAPPLERTKLTSITYSGTQIGNIITIPLAALLCYYVSWEAVFYLFGIFGLVWCFFWFLIASNSPDECKRINSKEQSYINSSLDGQVQQRKTTGKSSNELRKPWLKFLKSRPVWAIVVSDTCACFGISLVQTSLPLFMSEVLHFDIQSNGLLSALPFVAFWGAMTFAGFMADFLIRKKILSTTKTRKLHMLISQIGQAGALIAVGYCEQGQEMLAVALLTLSQGISGLQYGGYTVNHVDIAPRFAGTLLGISNTVSTVSGIAAPFIAASLTPDKTILQWRLVFIITGAILIFGSLFYALFGSGQLQSWAEIPTEAASEQTERQRGGRAEENPEGRSKRISL